MDIKLILKNRYATKKFDPNKKITSSTFDQLTDLLRLTPTSINSQPYHFIVVTSDQGKEKIIPSMNGIYESNKSKIMDASHIIIVCTKTKFDMDYLNTIIDKEERDGRFSSKEIKKSYIEFYSQFLESHYPDPKELISWMSNQCYIAIGNLLISSFALGIDALPMEGFDNKILDKEFDLSSKDLKSLTIVSLGYRSKDDFNSKLTKSRLEKNQLFSFY